VAAFIGMSLLGFGLFHVPLLYGVSSMLARYVLTLAMVYVLALIVDALAPSFGGTRDRLRALKLVVYGSTAAMVGGVFSLLPALWILGLLAALYSIYLFYLGLPTLMKCPQDKAAAYTAVVAVIGIVGGMVVGALAAASLPGMHGGMGGMWGASQGGDTKFTIGTPKAQVTIDTAKMQEFAKQMEAAGQRAPQVAATTAAAGGALSAQELKAFLPEALGEFKRESIEAMGDGQSVISMASATYRSAERSLKLSITDVGGGMGAAAGLWAAMTVDRETADEVEKVYRQGARSVHEKYRKDGSGGEYALILANGTMLGAEGHGVDYADLKRAVAGIDAGKLEALPRPAVKQ